MITFDLFAGAGGASEGLIAASHDLYGERPGYLASVNHWPVAIATHKRNHPWANHFCEDIRRVDPRRALGLEERGGSRKRVRIGVAGPDCTHFSSAKGAQPRNAKSRSLAWDVVRWTRKTEPENLVIENVPEFRFWGALDETGRPIKERRGEYFDVFLNSLRALGYNLDWRILKACDYGDATSRRRLFILGRRQDINNGQVVWPDQTHGTEGNLFGLPAYRTAREIIDWSIPGESIFGRKRRLADSTEARIADGLIRFCGEPFLLGIGGPSGRQCVKSVDSPLATILTKNHEYIAVPYLLRYNGGGRVQSLDAPLTTLDTSNRFALVSAFLISYHGNDKSHTLEEPLRTLRTHDRFGLVQVQKALSERGLCIADITLRMLRPHEQAAAHSFDASFQFEGSLDEQTAQVGGSWPVRTATALCKAMLGGYPA